MKIKKPSVRGMKHVGYLGRFQKDKFIQDGHNTTPKDKVEEVMIGKPIEYGMIGTKSFDDEEPQQIESKPVSKKQESDYGKNRDAVEKLKNLMNDRGEKNKSAIERVKDELALDKRVKERERIRRKIKKSMDY